MLFVRRLSTLYFSSHLEREGLRHTKYLFIHIMTQSLSFLNITNMSMGGPTQDRIISIRCLVTGLFTQQTYS